ncbi:ABC transporter ATP-binding protein [Deferrisoma sp.]
MLRALAPFWGHLRGKAGSLALLFLLGLLGSGISLSTPLVGKAFVDAVAERRDFSVVPWVAAALAGLAVLDLALGLALRLVHAQVSARVLVEIRQRLFDRCLDGPLEHLERFRHGDLMSRFGGDVPQIQALLVDGLLGGVRNLLFLAVAAGILVRLQPALAAWSFAGVAVALGAAAAFRGPVEAMARAIRQAMADLSHFLSERLSGLRVVRFHATQPEERAEFDRLNRVLVGRVLRFQGVDAAAAGVPGLVLTWSLAWIYLLGGRLLEAGDIGLGTFVAFVLYQGRLYGPAQGLLGLVRNLQEARVSLSRVAEVLDRDEGPRLRARKPGEAEIRFEDVWFSYPGKAPVLRGLHLRVAAGEKVAVFGGSGAGKSTLVQLAFGLRRPTRGRVEVGGVNPWDLSSEDLRRFLGYAGAEPFLLHATVEENLRYGNPGVSDEAVLAAARLALAHEFILSLPEGYRTVIGGRGLALSDGQRQRIGLARLILRAPRVFVLDEAFCALDPATEARIVENLWRSFPDRAFLVIAHRWSGSRAFDRRLVLRDGTLWPAELGCPAAGRAP